MLTFVGLLVFTYIVWAELRRISRVLGGIGLILERLANRAAERNGEEPVITAEDVAQFK